MRFLCVLRHADYAGASPNSPLSVSGKQAAESLARHLNEWRRRERVLSITGFCSNTARAEKTLRIAVPNPDATVILDILGAVAWDKVDVNDAFGRIDAHCDAERCELALVVSHGNASFYLLQAAFARCQLGSPPNLPTTCGNASRTAHGFLLDVERGVAYSIDPVSGIKSL